MDEQHDAQPELLWGGAEAIMEPATETPRDPPRRRQPVRRRPEAVPGADPGGDPAVVPMQVASEAIGEMPPLDASAEPSAIHPKPPVVPHAPEPPPSRAAAPRNAVDRADSAPKPPVVAPPPPARPVAADDAPAAARERAVAAAPPATRTHADMAPAPAPTAPEAPVAPPPPDRTTSLRMARLHLRVGLLSLASAELEAEHAAGSIDQPGLADLAESRWRARDTAGAGEAAQAHLEGGGRETAALVVIADWLASQGRLADARRFAAQVLRRDPDGAERLLGEVARGPAWPEPERRTEPSQSSGPDGDVEPLLPALGARPGGTHVRGGRTPGATERDVVPLAAPQQELTALDALVAVEAYDSVPLRLSLLLRAHPRLTPAIISLVDRALAAGVSGVDGAAFRLVRGDAYRVLGRDREASEAFESARAALAGVDGPSDPDLEKETQ
jgi:hypothetical protein